MHAHCCLRPATHAAHITSLTNLHAGPLLLLARSHCPNHPTASLNPNYAIGSSRTYTIPVNPRYNAAQQTSLTALGAIVGVAYDGGMIYSPFAGPSYPLTGWTTSAAYLEGNTFDQCGGHSSSTTSPSYHYHVAPSCLLKQLGMTAGQHSPQIGWMADGFPLYGPLGPNGVVMQTCTVTGGTVGTSVCLDACGGYLADTGDGFAYRYYMPGTFNSGQCNEMPAPAPVGGGANYYPQSPTCLRGCCPSGVTCSMGSVNLPTCSAAATAGTTATFIATTASALPINSAAVSSASSAAAQRSTLCCSSANIASVSTSPTPTQACSTLGHCAVDDCVYSTSAAASSSPPTPSPPPPSPSPPPPSPTTDPPPPPSPTTVPPPSPPPPSPSPPPPSPSPPPPVLGGTASTTAGQEVNSNSLNATECKVPVASGGWGFCGPLTCNANYKTCGGTNGGGPPTVNGVTGSWRSGSSASTCVNYYDLQSTSAHQPNALPSAHAPQGSCRATCTQRTTGICSGSFLANVLKGRGVKYAYCNDKWLVIGATGESGHWTPNLNDVPNPPGTTVGGVGYCTGELTMTVGIARTTFFPLDIVDLPTGVSTNNIHLFDGSTTIGGNTGPITNRDSSKSIGATAYGLPNGAGVGTMVNGIANWVTQNDQGEWSEGVCEVDSCNQHVGQGGGQPHAHGDMFADTHTCLYGTSNYSSGVNGHPPVIGFANDGHLIYGRYLSNSAPGFGAPLLDQCGGHKHDVTTDVDEHGLNLHNNYHYHTQVFDAVCGARDRCTSGVRYTASSTGPLFCYRANLTASEGSAALLGATSRYGATQTQMNYRCCGMTDYYMLNGVPAGVSDASTTFAASSTCTLPAIANGAYETSGSCVVGATMYSGYQCTPTCSAGFAASGKTRCVKGVLVETATCVMPSPSPPPPSPSPPPPTSTSTSSPPPPSPPPPSPPPPSPSPPPPSPTTDPPPPPSPTTVPPPSPPPPSPSPPPPAAAGFISCPTGSNYVGSATRIGSAPALRGSLGCVDTAAISYRQTLSSTIAGTSTGTTTVNIYGPFEAGFSSTQPGMSCLGTNSVVGGIDTYTAELMIRNMCSENSISLLDTCGDHASPRHFHEMLTNCLSGQAASGHSTRLGTSGDNRGIYGFFEANNTYPVLDVCGAHVGVTPDSNGQPVVHYHSQVYPPFFVGCYTNASSHRRFVLSCAAPSRGRRAWKSVPSGSTSRPWRGCASYAGSCKAAQSR